MQDDFKQWFDDVDAYTALHGQRYQNAADQNDNDAVDVAKLLIQSLFLIHGGALLAIPAFVTMRPEMAHYTLVALFVCFGLGLTLAFAAGLCAFFALAERSDGHSTLRDAVPDRAWARAAKLKFLISRNPDFADFEAQSNTAADAIDSKAQPHFKRYSLWRGWGIICVVTSIVALMIGSVTAALAV